ncbi:hypothetical protein [Microseira wollei]|nr:hypothetical protein [Microseira wollei]
MPQKVSKTKSKTPTFVVEIPRLVSKTDAGVLSSRGLFNGLGFATLNDKGVVASQASLWGGGESIINQDEKRLHPLQEGGLGGSGRLSPVK